MTWQERVREGAYTPPSGIRLTFQYEDVSRETDKRTAGFQFPNVDGAYVQDNGIGTRRYPLRCYFSGPSHDLAATAFEVALFERGPGRLEHPFYGDFDAIPFGTITRRDDLATGANQSVIEVTFWKTLGVLYPNSTTSPRDELLAALDAYDLASFDDFVEASQLVTSAGRAATKTATRSLLRVASDALGVVAGAVSASNDAFRDAQSAINYGIDVLIGQPLQLAQQISNLMKAPSLAVIGIADRLAGYRDFAQRIYASISTSPVDSATLTGLQLRLTNGFATADLYAGQAVAGSLRAVFTADFVGKPGALMAADDVLSQFDAYVAWRDAARVSLGLVDPGGAHQALLHAAAQAAGYLVQASYDLAPERRLVLDRARTLIDVAAELFGSVDDRLDYLIEVNDFTGQEILELQRGTTVAYYL